MATFSQIEEALDNVRQDILQAGAAYNHAARRSTEGDNLLKNLPATYGGIVTAVNDQAAANPDSPLWQTVLGRKNALVAERAELLANTTAAVAFFEAVEAHGAAAVQAALDGLGA